MSKASATDGSNDKRMMIMRKWNLSNAQGSQRFFFSGATPAWLLSHRDWASSAALDSGLGGGAGVGGGVFSTSPRRSSKRALALAGCRR